MNNNGTSQQQETTMSMTMAAATTAGDLVNSKTICLALKIGRFGNHKQASLAGAVLSKDDSSQEPDKTLLSLSKRLLDSPELYAIGKHDATVASRVRQLAFTSLFKGGIYLIPIGMVETVEKILAEALETRKTLVDRAVEMYPTRIEETCKRLGVQANAGDYPSVERFRASFYMEHQYVTFETPSKLKAISTALFQAEVEKNRARLESVALECQQTMRAALLGLVEHLKDRLMPTDDGKHKRLHQATIGNINDFLAQFELRNVTDDAELGALVIKARAVMAGADHSLLKSDELVRQKLVADLGDLKAALDPLILEKGTRVITFEEDEASAEAEVVVLESAQA
jgi:hypothetical protein